MARKSARNWEPRADGGTQPIYISPKELKYRWQCSRTQVDRIARREGLTRVLLGSGRNGMVRYVREEIESLESRCRVGT